MSREIFCEDALSWLKNYPISPESSLIASLPDISEFPGYSLEAWTTWFIETAKLILLKTPEKGVTIFYQSDIKLNSAWIDKSYLVLKAAQDSHDQLLWHKIICRHPPGTITFGRPSYSHLLCFSKGFSLDLSLSSADVIPLIGEKTWERGMGLEACVLIAKFIKEQINSKTIIHPFCGEGLMMATADFFGLQAIGIERSKKRAERAKSIKIDFALETKKYFILKETNQC
jgi:hypothetical protein